MLNELARIRNRKVSRVSSWDTTGRNADSWQLGPGEARVLADIKGPGQITHIWMTQGAHYRECLLRITWDDARRPSVLVPLGDFFCLGNGLVNSFQSLLFTASTNSNNQFNAGCALNCYAPMPFRERASSNWSTSPASGTASTSTSTTRPSRPRRPRPRSATSTPSSAATNPFGGWGHEIRVNTPEANIVNKGELAWENNYVILETRGRGHYIGCNLSVTNFQGTWWGEGDDMIWVDGYKWPPDLHGTGSEDYLNQAWGMQPNAFLRNGSSHLRGQHGRLPDQLRLPPGEPRPLPEGDQGHHRARPRQPPGQRDDQRGLLVRREADCRPSSRRPSPSACPSCSDNHGNWLHDKRNQCPGEPVKVNAEMRKMKKKWAAREKGR